jgi:GNAT superfamily N-acetyltransferase
MSRHIVDLYASLYLSPPSIRLLEVLPARNPSNGIECRLMTYNLYSAPPYKALSYAWGEDRGVVQKGEDEVLRREGRVNIKDGELSHVTVTVSPSLTLAIRRLRRKDYSVLLWIDSICINQKDDDERAEQVAMMGTIYERASEVIIWLGEREVEDELGEWLKGIYSRTVVYFDWDSDKVARALVDRYIDMYRMLRDTHKGPMTQRRDIYGTYCLIWLLAQGHKSADIVFYNNNVFTDDFRMEWAMQVSEGLRAIMARDWVCTAP